MEKNIYLQYIYQIFAFAYSYLSDKLINLFNPTHRPSAIIEDEDRKNASPLKFTWFLQRTIAVVLGRNISSSVSYRDSHTQWLPFFIESPIKTGIESEYDHPLLDKTPNGILFRKNPKSGTTNKKLIFFFHWFHCSSYDVLYYQLLPFIKKGYDVALYIFPDHLQRRLLAQDSGEFYFLEDDSYNYLQWQKTISEAASFVQHQRFSNYTEINVLACDLGCSLAASLLATPTINWPTKQIKRFVTLSPIFDYQHAGFITKRLKKQTNYQITSLWNHLSFMNIQPQFPIERLYIIQGAYNRIQPVLAVLSPLQTWLLQLSSRHKWRISSHIERLKINASSPKAQQQLKFIRQLKRLPMSERVKRFVIQPSAIQATDVVKKINKLYSTYTCISWNTGHYGTFLPVTGWSLSKKLSKIFTH